MAAICGTSISFISNEIDLIKYLQNLRKSQKIIFIQNVLLLYTHIIKSKQLLLSMCSQKTRFQLFSDVQGLQINHLSNKEQKKENSYLFLAPTKPYSIDSLELDRVEQVHTKKKPINEIELFFSLDT